MTLFSAIISNTVLTSRSSNHPLIVTQGYQSVASWLEGLLKGVIDGAT